MLRRLFTLSIALGAALTSASAQLSPTASWAAASVASYVVREATYLTVDGKDLKLDVYSRRDRVPRPTMIYVHGGGWTSGQKNDVTMYIMPYLEMGWNVLNVEYRLAGVAVAPAAVTDCFCALRWAVKNARQYGIDTTKIVVTGDSAGSHLALMMGVAPDALGLDKPCAPADNAPLPKVAAIVNWYGISDVNDILDGPRKQGYAAQWLKGVENPAAMAKRLSPITYVRAGLPPIISIQGDKDPSVPYSQTVAFTEALKAAKVPTELVTIPNGGHGQFPADERIRAFVAIRNFLAKNGVPEAAIDYKEPAKK